MFSKGAERSPCSKVIFMNGIMIKGFHLSTWHIVGESQHRVCGLFIYLCFPSPWTVSNIAYNGPMGSDVCCLLITQEPQP